VAPHKLSLRPLVGEDDGLLIPSVKHPKVISGGQPLDRNRTAGDDIVDGCILHPAELFNCCFIDWRFWNAMAFFCGVIDLYLDLPESILDLRWLRSPAHPVVHPGIDVFI